MIAKLDVGGYVTRNVHHGNHDTSNELVFVGVAHQLITRGLRL